MAAATAAQRTPMGDPVPQTPFAKKYGVAPIDPDNLFRPYGKSGGRDISLHYIYVSY